MRVLTTPVTILFNSNCFIFINYVHIYVAYVTVLFSTVEIEHFESVKKSRPAGYSSKNGHMTQFLDVHRLTPVSV
jgi:hypothetical protein